MSSASQSGGDESKSLPCPGCGKTIPQAWLLCLHCGFDTRTGARRPPRLQKRPSIPGAEVAAAQQPAEADKEGEPAAGPLAEQHGEESPELVQLEPLEGGEPIQSLGGSGESPHCAHCGGPLPSDAEACPSCGRLTERGRADTRPPTAQQPVPVTPSPGAALPAALRLVGEGPATPTQAPPATQAQQGPTHPCPTCHAPVPEGAVLCTNCGTHIHSGRRLLTKSRGHLGDEAEEIRSWVTGLSLLLPFAIVPYRTTIPQLRSRRANTILVVATCVLSIAALISILTESETLARSGDSVISLLIEGRMPELRPDSVLVKYGLWRGEHFAAVQLVSHLFLHGGLVHLAGNMLFLWMFGAAVNSVLGWEWYPALYLVLGALAGYLGHVVFGTYGLEVPLIGASGAICGLTGLYLVLFPRHDIHMAIWFRFAWWTQAWIKTFAVTGIYAVLLFTAFDVAALLLRWTGSVAHAVHICGFLSGILLGIVFLLTGFVKSEGYDLLSWILGDRWRFGRARLGHGIVQPESRR